MKRKTVGMILFFIFFIIGCILITTGVLLLLFFWSLGLFILSLCENETK